MIEIRDVLKKSNILRNAVRMLRDGAKTNHDIVQELAAFSPASAGPLPAIAGMALQSAHETFPLICSLIRATSQSLKAPRSIETIFSHVDPNQVQELAELFNRYGSDKSRKHNYHLLYGPMLAQRRRDRLCLLEIGIGTNNQDVVSTMGASGKPGASLRAFRDFCPSAKVFGADIDRRVLFEEERIRTYYVDQTRHSSFNELYVNLAGHTFDLVIDDGLHSPSANIGTMLFALRILRPSGFFVAEDIHPNSLSIWQVVAAILPESYRPNIVLAKDSLMFMTQKTM